MIAVMSKTVPVPPSTPEEEKSPPVTGATSSDGLEGQGDEQICLGVGG